LVGSLRLLVDTRLAAVIVKRQRGNLSASIAIDAARVDEKFSVYVFSQSVFALCH
jgi:hypothetical protein